jgi:hypothetical protein
MFEGIEAKAILKHCVLYTQVAVTQGRLPLVKLGSQYLVT